jgi:pimeloyl-ACP methyl ester carboxylesterase
MRQVPTLLLLHGGPGFDHSGFKPAFAEMATVAQVVYLDLRGNGRSDAGPANENLEGFEAGLALHTRSFWKPPDLTVFSLMRRVDLPLLWNAQEQALGLR